MNFIINPFYKSKKSGLDLESIQKSVNSAVELIYQYNNNIINSKDFILIGEGNNANGKVYSIVNSSFCLKISKLGKHVGENQERQFLLNEQCIEAIENKKVNIEGDLYDLTSIRTIAVAVDERLAYTLMIRLDGVIRLWDEQNVIFKDKDNWEIIKEIKNILREYAKIKDIGEESFIASMDINGNNLMVDIIKRKIFLIDPYVPEAIQTENELLFEEVIMGSWLYEYLEIFAKIDIPNWYIGAGTIAQTIWNYLHKFEGKYGIKDVDVIYYDLKNASSKAEVNIKNKLIAILPKKDIEVDVVNEARVHLWYESMFGKKITQYKSSEDAINSWPTTATSIGIRMNINNELKVYATFGLDDLMNMIIRPNKKLINEKIYNEKVLRWKSIWPLLKFHSW